MALIDSHCHLDLYPDPHKVVREAVSKGVYVLSVTTTPSAFEGTLKLAGSAPRIQTALGLHPELAVARQHELPLFEHLLSRTEYVGEVGLDGSKPHRGTLERQAEILMAILMMCARAGGKTITLHSRDARPMLLDLLATEPLAGRPILHWFTGSPKEIEQAADLGCWFSVGPAMLSGDRGLRSTAQMPRNRILPETDGPFGLIDRRPGYPWEAMQVAPKLAELWGVSSDDAERQLVENFTHLSKLTRCKGARAFDQFPSVDDAIRVTSPEAQMEA